MCNVQGRLGVGEEPESGGLDRGSPRPQSVAIAVSSHITTVYIYVQIARLIADLPPESIILLRRPRLNPPGIMELAISEMVAQDVLADHHLSVEWFEPAPGDRSQTYQRDFEMVSVADRVVAYFDEGHIMEGGTGHVVEAALAREVPVEAWAISGDGRIWRVGEIDPV